ncbi:hypothetical protein SVAN01_02659 [Stagonosporopsis vannaccii]|nr:hypothetical protein SVAN01_02659 [Stagonosporopsis vannaccii]
MATKYESVYPSPNGRADSRPTTNQIVKDEKLLVNC